MRKNMEHRIETPQSCRQALANAKAILVVYRPNVAPHIWQNSGSQPDNSLKRLASPSAAMRQTVQLEPKHVLMSGICGRCWAARGTDRNRRAAIFDGLRRNYGLEGLRVLPLLAAAGHA
jgi:hypothetical protein